jgi:hypothetical protein
LDDCGRDVSFLDLRLVVRRDEPRELDSPASMTNASKKIRINGCRDSTVNDDTSLNTCHIYITKNGEMR